MNKSLLKLTGEEKVIFKGKLIEIVEQKIKTDDHEFILERAKRPPGTRLIIVSPDKKILLTKEYRPEYAAWDFRLPGGKVIDSLDEYNQLKNNRDVLEMAEEGAKKEALEEVGIVVDEIKHFTTSLCGVTIVWDLYFFVVTKYHEHPEGQQLEEDENIEPMWVSFDEAKRMCLDGSIGEDRSAAVLFRFLSQSS